MSTTITHLPEGFEWVPVPPNAVAAGTETSGDALYVARVADGNTTYIGKCGQWHIRGAIAVRDGQEQLFNEYESGALDVSTLGGIPFSGGTDANGTALFVSRTKIAAPATGTGEECSFGFQPGSIGMLKQGARIAYNGAEYIGNQYEVLVLAVGSIYWASSSRGNIPGNDLPAGHDSDACGALYIARAPLRVDGITTRRLIPAPRFHRAYLKHAEVGKAGVHLGGGSFAVGDKEIFISDVEILVGDLRTVRWVPFEGRFVQRYMDGFPVPAGIDADGATLFAAITQIDTAVHTGDGIKVVG